MRHTLSVLSAACLLALGQPVWSESTSDRELALRARTAALALALPAADRACASLLLQQWQVEAEPFTPHQRHLPFHTLFQAVSQVLEHHYRTSAIAHCCPHPLLSSRQEMLIVSESTLSLDSAMIQRWLTPWLHIEA